MQDVTSKRFLLIDKGKDSKNPFDILKGMYLIESRRMFPNVPDNLRTTPAYTDKTTVELTMCITDFIRLSGGEAERINCVKRKKDNRIIYADILALIEGQHIVIKVKKEKKLLSQTIKQNEQHVEHNGILNFIARDFEQFYNWYLSNFGRTLYETK